MQRIRSLRGVLEARARVKLASELPSESIHDAVRVGFGMAVIRTELHLVVIRIGPLGGDRGSQVIPVDAIEKVHVEPSAALRDPTIKILHAGSPGIERLTVFRGQWERVEALILAAVGSALVEDAAWRLHEDAVARFSKLTPEERARRREEARHGTLPTELLDGFTYPVGLDLLYGKHRAYEKGQASEFKVIWGLRYVGGVPAFDVRYRTAAASERTPDGAIFRGVSLIDRGLGLVVQGAIGRDHRRLSVHWPHAAVEGVEVHKSVWHADPSRWAHGTPIRHLVGGPPPAANGETTDLGLVSFAIRTEEGIRFVSFAARSNRLRNVIGYLRQIYPDRLHVFEGTTALGAAGVHSSLDQHLETLTALLERGVITSEEFSDIETRVRADHLELYAQRVS